MHKKRNSEQLSEENPELTARVLSGENASHEEVFGHLKDAEFTADEASQYLEVSIATFRRYCKQGKVTASSIVGTSHLYPLEDLRALKKALKIVR